MDDGLEILEPTDLYNMLQQATVFSNLSDPNYLLLIDSRKKNEYNESHIVTAKKAPKNESGDFMVPYDAELECKQNVVVYDSNTNSLRESPDNPALDCGRLMWEMGSRNRVKILKGGYEEFSALYPFLRTQKIMFMPKTTNVVRTIPSFKSCYRFSSETTGQIFTKFHRQEMDELKTYPIEIIHGLLYLGNWRQGNAAYIQKDLKIKGHVNCCVEPETLMDGSGPHSLHLQVEDNESADLFSKFQTSCIFIDTHKDAKETVLVFSNLGISRSVTIVTAYLMHHFKWTLKEAYALVSRCCPTVRPNRAFIQQLSKWEEEVLGAKTTNIEDPYY